MRKHHLPISTATLQHRAETSMLWLNEKRGTRKTMLLLVSDSPERKFSMLFKLLFKHCRKCKVLLRK